MKNFRFAAKLAFSAVILLFGCKDQPSGNDQGSMIPRGQETHLDRFEHEIQAYELQDKKKMPPKGAVLFTGSSSIRLWSTLERDFAPIPVINRGFGGSTLPEVLYYADRINYKYDPSLIVLYCGENDLQDDTPPAVVFQDFKKYIGETEKNLGDIPIIYISAKPSPARWNNWRKFQTLNGMIETFAGSRPHLHYVDISKTLLADGKPDPGLYVKDQLHLNEEGYRQWTAVLRPLIEELYEEQLTQ